MESISRVFARLSLFVGDLKGFDVVDEVNGEAFTAVTEIEAQRDEKSSRSFAAVVSIDCVLRCARVKSINTSSIFIRLFSFLFSPSLSSFSGIKTLCREFLLLLH